MEYFRIKTTVKNYIDDLKRVAYKLPEDKDIEIIAKSPKTVNQNNCYNSYVNLLADDVGSTDLEFKHDMKYELGLYEKIEYKGERYIKWTESNDFTTEDWDKVFLYLEQHAAFLNVTLPPMKPKEKSGLRFN